MTQVIRARKEIRLHMDLDRNIVSKVLKDQVQVPTTRSWILAHKKDIQSRQDQICILNPTSPAQDNILRRLQ